MLSRHETISCLDRAGRVGFCSSGNVVSEEQCDDLLSGNCEIQQTVEKSVKAMVAAVNDLGSDLTVTASHLPTNEIDSLLRVRRAIDNVSVDRLVRIFEIHRASVEGLCSLAPRWPEDGKSFARNTEYPYLRADTWTAPAVQDSFTLQETVEAQKTARAFHKAAIDFVSSVKFGRF